jgi:hypothetical protein
MANSNERVTDERWDESHRVVNRSNLRVRA